jgi:hypothetical protein
MSRADWLVIALAGLTLGALARLVALLAFGW